jgi:ubiquinone/menaquinone biosynthesis C-methylase UbiE
MLGRDPGRVLDLCAGSGYLGRLVAKDCSSADVVALDLSAEMLAFGRWRAAGQGLRRIAFVQADASSLPFATNSFDVVVTAFGMHELRTDVRSRAAAEVGRVLRPQGRFLLADLDTPRGKHPTYYTYVRLAHHVDAFGVFGVGLRKCLEDLGFEIVAHQPSLGSIVPFQILDARAPSSGSEA